MPVAIDSTAHITAVGGPYEGLDVHSARARVLADLEAGGFLVKTEPYTHNVPTCDRCGTVLEPLLSEQWFMHMEQLARPAIDVVESGQVRFVPERWSRVYLDWMENIRPWTLSRQLWWGHRIPIYYCAGGHTVAAKSKPDACDECGAQIESQDPDVLDTWFSSALWPFATLGWPARTEDLGRYYPTSFMNTSSQILYLWIARMIMTGLKFMDDVPYPVVLINPTILNKQGQRMSKSLGTGVDPLDLVQEYGADALRFGLITSGSTHQQDIRFSPEKVEEARNFANKVWNIARFILSSEVPDENGGLRLTTADRWILSRLSAVTTSVTRDLERFELSGAGQTLQDFLWSELADWYVEMAKVRLYGDDIEGQRTVRAVLWSALDRSVRLLQPYMPFLAEELWQQVRRSGSSQARALSGWDGELPESVMLAPWPEAAATEAEAERALEQVIDIVRSARTVRSEYKVEPGKYISATIVAGSRLEQLAEQASVISRLARLAPIGLVAEQPAAPSATVALLNGGVTVYLPLAELTDVAAERARLERELADAERGAAGSSAKIANEQFVSRAPAAVVERERERARELEARVEQLQAQLRALEG
jgi:valyl-tRNA synthetase